MFYILFFIFILAIILLAYFMITSKVEVNGFPLTKARQIKQKNKEEAKNKILDLFKSQEKIYNYDVENLLSVSDATATNYLDELEKEGKITQYGKIGRGVFYIKNRQING